MCDLMLLDIDQKFYTPLLGKQAFRLIILEPGGVLDPLLIRLQVAEPLTTPEYDAISYVWGDPRQKVTIQCDGKPFDITVTLYWALIRARDTHNAKFLWADAVCINQSDLHERSHQVSFMGLIYSRARKVYLCMGDDENNRAFEVKTVIRDSISLASGGHFPVLPNNHPLRNDKRWYALTPLTRNPWFRRAWVVQEAALAQDPVVLYGQAEFAYRDLVAVLKWLNVSAWSRKFELSSFFIHLEWADWRKPPPNVEYSFVDLLSHAALLSCSDPRDKVYAFLGHPLAYLPSKGRLLVTPDYRMETKQVYYELSKSLIEEMGLRVLTTVEHTNDTIIEEFPSWVTRWDVSLVWNDIYRIPNTIYNVSAGLGQQHSISISGEYLAVRSVILDRVRKSFRVEIRDETGIRFEDAITGEVITLKDVLRELDSMAGSSAYVDQVDAFCRTLCIGVTALSGSLSRHGANLAIYFERTRRNSRASDQSQEDIPAYYSEIRGVCMNRSVAITETGLFVLAPLLTRPGDVSCVLIGAAVPFMLRPSGDNARFKLLGESYVHGIMNGEVSHMVRRDEVVEQTIIIS